MKKKLFALLLVALCAMSCQNSIWDAIHDLEDKYTDLDGRVAKLEELCKEMNTNISSLQTLVSVILTNDYIISTTPITKDGKEIGYTITFAIHEPITIYHGQNGKDGANGKDGKDGENGENGTNGQDGKDGADGITPIIGVAQDETDHAYYWTLNGEWLLDANGNRIPLTSRDGINGQDGQDGKDGKNGKDGTNGQDGITPRLKIENGYWFISYDNGVTWVQLGKAVGENGQDGKDGTNGQDGEKGDKGDPGEPGYSMFTEVTQDDEFVYFTLYNGTILTVRKGNSSFEQTIIDNLVTSLSLDYTEVWMSAIGETVQVTATTVPFPTSKVFWESEDSSIVTVNNGLLTAVHSGGPIIITAKSGEKVQQLKVYVSIEEGVLNGEFSISSTKKVRFSQGRLQYNPTKGSHRCGGGVLRPGTWRFAEEQYEVINELCTDNLSNSWSDLFYFGTSGYETFVPWGSVSPSQNLNSNTDWGKYNAIWNGGNMPNLWRCLTNLEWKYVLDERTNAASLRAYARINGVNGTILLPDNCSLPTGISFNTSVSALNTYDVGQWKILEGIGAVFFPSNVYAGNTCAISWTSVSPTVVANGWDGCFSLSQYGGGNLTCSIRLVKDIE